jgi:hypothetical protein
MQPLSIVAFLAIRARTTEQVKAFRDKQLANRRPAVATDRLRVPADPVGDGARRTGAAAA